MGSLGHRVVVTLLVSTVAAACAPATFELGRAWPPSQLSRRAGDVRYAYFTTAAVRAGSLAERDLPLAYEEFDVARDPQIIFVSVINALDRPFVRTGVLKRPDGTPHRRFRYTDSGISPILSSDRWYWHTQTFVTSLLADFPGRWTLDLSVDDRLVGTYSFLLANSGATARHHSPSRQPATTAATAPAPTGTAIAPQTALVIFDGPPGATIELDGQRHTIDSQGKLTVQARLGVHQVSATKEGFLPWVETLRVDATQAGAPHSVRMVPVVPPMISVLAPAVGGTVGEADAALKVEVRSPYRIAALRIDPPTGSSQTLTPAVLARPGEPWIIQSTVILVEGENVVRLVATDEHGTTATETVVLRRRSLVALDLTGPAGADVRVDDRRHTLDARGRLSLKLAPGTYEIEARRQGSSPWRDRVTLEAGAAAHRHITFGTLARPTATITGLGRYHALVIANQAYAHLRPLQTPLADGTAVADVLKQSYLFDSIQILRNATRHQIVAAFDDLRRRLGENDNLLIYYAGHGSLDLESGRGYWLPVDAEAESRSNWLSNADITDTLKALRAKHVVVVADSCYSGTLTRNVGVHGSPGTDLARLAQRRARTVLTSGGLEPVVDSGGGKHSVFAKAFLEVLRDNQGVADLTSLFVLIRRQVLLHALQTPEYADIRLAGHEGGDFIFARGK